MTEQYEGTKADLLGELNDAWAAFNAALDNLSPAQLTGPTDAAGWRVIDHINHMAAWENSIVALLQGRPRYEGLGIDKTLYVNGSEDAVNDALYRRDSALSAAQARAALRDTHTRLLAEIDRLSDADLHQPVRHFWPDWTGEGDGPAAIAVINGDAVEHYYEHLGWIQTPAAQS